MNANPDSYFLENADKGETILSEHEQLSVVELAEEFFNNRLIGYVYSGNVEEYIANPTDSGKFIVEKLEKFCKKNQKKVGKAALLFLERIYIEITNGSTDVDENILLIFHKELFRTSVLVDKLSNEDRIKIFSRFSRYLDLHKYSNAVFLKIVDDFKKEARFDKSLLNCGIANQIDIILMVERVAEFLNEGQEKYSMLFCLKFLSDFIDNTEFPIARALASQIYSNIENKNFSRSSDRHGQELQIISSDYIGQTDQSGMLDKVAPYSGDIQLGEPRPLGEIFEDFCGKVFPDEMSNTDLFFLFKQLHRPEVKKIFEQDFGVSYSELVLFEQVNILKYLAEKNSNVLERLHNIAKKDFRLKKEVLSAFLACVVDGDFDNGLLGFAENESVETVISVLGLFNNLISKIKEVDQIIKKNIYEKHSYLNRTYVIQEFIKRTIQALKKAIIQPHKAREIFNAIDADALLFGSMFKTAIKTLVISEIKDVASFDIKNVLNQELSVIEKNEMLGVVAQNWLPRGEVGAEVVSRFKKKIDSDVSLTKWAILKKDKKVISFVGFESLDSKDGRQHLYAGSFNVDTKFRGSSIGDIMIREVLIRESKRAVLHATMDPQIDIGTRYVEDIGFLVTGVAEKYLDTSESFFEITADHTVLGNFESRMWTREQTLEFAREHSREPLVAQAERGDIIVASVTRDAGAEPEFISGAAEILRAGFIGTRYIPDGPDSKVRYMIFEKQKSQKML